MRYDKQIYFVTPGEKEYDFNTGNYIASEPTKEKHWANITTMGTSKQELIFGGLNQNALTIRIQGNYEGDFEHIEYDGKDYNIEFERKLRSDHVFQVSEKL